MIRWLACGSTAMRRRGVRRTLKLDLILDHQGLALGVNLLGELGRDGMVSGSVLHDQTGIALHALVNRRLLDSPLADVGPLFIALNVLLGMRGLPPLVPALGELLEEWSFELGGLDCDCVSGAIHACIFTANPNAAAAQDSERSN